MPNKACKTVKELLSVWRTILRTGNQSILKKLSIVWNLFILKEHLIYNKIDSKIISTLSSDVVDDSFSTINERIQKEKEKKEKEEEKQTRRMLEEVLKVMKTLQKQD